MLACVHYSPETGEVLGLWTLDKHGVPRPTYLERGGDAEFWAATTMAATVADVCWPRFWEQLAGRAPYWIWWAVLQVADGASPLRLLEQLPPLDLLDEACAEA
jgi:hypothetical protein